MTWTPINQFAVAGWAAGTILKKMCFLSRRGWHPWFIEFAKIPKEIRFLVTERIYVHFLCLLISQQNSKTEENCFIFISIEIEHYERFQETIQTIYKDEIFYECGETLERVPQRGGRCPMPGNFQCQVGQCSEKPSIFKDVATHCRGVCVEKLPLNAPPNPNCSRFYNSMIISSEKLNYASRSTMNNNLYCDLSSDSERCSQFSDSWLKSNTVTCSNYLPHSYLWKLLMDFWWRIINLYSGQKSSSEEVIRSGLACELQATEKDLARWFQRLCYITGKKIRIPIKAKYYFLIWSYVIHFCWQIGIEVFSENLDRIKQKSGMNIEPLKCLFIHFNKVVFAQFITKNTVCICRVLLKRKWFWKNFMQKRLHW